jgi:phytanoyl-CoA hydroxylase
MTVIAPTPRIPIDIDRFRREGYLVIDGVLDPQLDIAPLFAEYSLVLNDIATMLHAQCAIASTYEDLPFEARLIQLCVESGKNFPQHFDISLPQKGIRHDTPIHVGPAVFNLLSSPRLLDVVEQVIGPEIYCNPVQHIRMKLPERAVAKGGSFSGLVSRIPWHQDNGVVLAEADEATILTIWMPLNNATEENGCLQVIPNSHENGIEPHCPASQGLSIPEKLIATSRARTLPMKPGSVLLMTQRTVHSSLDNATDDQVRLSFDLRYQPIGQPTGRPHFPGFVVRSAAQPELVLHDHEVWARSWYDARFRLAEIENPSFNRWRADSPVCA